jgi:hypothetical protein
VLPDAWRNGDLSSLLAASTPIVVYDPQTGQPFPNNQIPVGRFSPFVRNLLGNESLYPRANVSRALSDFRNNYLGKSASREQTNQFDVKVDWNASTSDKSVRYSSRRTNRAPKRPPCRCSTAASANPFWSVGANWNRIIGTGSSTPAGGYNTTSATCRSTARPRSLNNQLGIGGSQPIDDTRCASATT